MFLSACRDRAVGVDGDGSVGNRNAIDSSVNVGPVCGDGVVQSPEECDGQDLNGTTCVDFGFAGGVLTCDPTCRLDTSGCVTPPRCGDGGVEKSGFWRRYTSRERR